MLFTFGETMKKLTMVLVLLLLSFSLLGAGCIESKTTNHTTSKTFHIIMTTSTVTSSTTLMKNITTITTIDVKKVFDYYNSIFLGRTIDESIVIMTDTYYPAGAALVSKNFRIIIPLSYVLSSTTYVVPLSNGVEKPAYYSFTAIFDTMKMWGIFGIDTAELTVNDNGNEYVVQYDNGIILLSFAYGTVKMEGEINDMLSILPPQIWPGTYYAISNVTYKFVTASDNIIIAEYSGKHFTIYAYNYTDLTTTSWTGSVIDIQIVPKPTRENSIVTTIVNGLKAVKIITSGEKTTIALPPQLENDANFFETVIQYTDMSWLETMRTLLYTTKLPPVTNLEAWKTLRLIVNQQFFYTSSTGSLKPLSAIIKYGAANNEEFAMFYVVALWALGETPTLNIVNNGKSKYYFVQDGKIAFINTIFGCQYDYLLNSIYAQGEKITITKITIPINGDYIVDYVTITTMNPLPIVYSGGASTIFETFFITVDITTSTIAYTYTMSNGTIIFNATVDGDTYDTTILPGDEVYEYFIPYIYRMKPLYTSANVFIDPYNRGLENITIIPGFDRGTILATVSYGRASVHIVYSIIHG